MRKKPKGLKLEYPGPKKKPASVELVTPPPAPLQHKLPKPTKLKGLTLAMLSKLGRSGLNTTSTSSAVTTAVRKLPKLSKRSYGVKTAAASSAVTPGDLPAVLLAAPAGHDPSTCDCLVCLHHLRIHPPAPSAPDPFSALIAQSELEDGPTDDDEDEVRFPPCLDPCRMLMYCVRCSTYSQATNLCTQSAMLVKLPDSQSLSDILPGNLVHCFWTS